jgi:hypothetical protein
MWDGGRNSNARSAKMSLVGGDKTGDEGDGRNKMGRSLIPARRL